MSQNPNRVAARGTDIELTVDRLTFGGRAIGRMEGLAVFVDGALPGERVRARVLKRKSSFAETRAVEILQPSPHRIPAKCSLFGHCGGCAWQSLPYEEQAIAKENIVRETLEHLAGIRDIPVRPIVAAPSPFQYRNKVEFTFGTDENRVAVAGFHRTERWDQILDVDPCWIAPLPMSTLLRVVVDAARESAITTYNAHIHKGFLRHLIVRHSVHSDKFIAVLLTNERGNAEWVASLWEKMRAVVPQLQGFVWGINDSWSDVARAQEVLNTWGDPVLIERLGPLEFRISPTSFFQTNSLAAAKLYDCVEDALDLTGEQTLLDAYCGTGTIGIRMAPRAKTVWGIEIITEAVWDARENCARNNISNARFLAGDVKKTLPLVIGEAGGFDRVVVDPPRGGMERKALDQLLAINAPIFVYVSCNPATMGRDLEQIAASGYTFDYVQPVDLFPQTWHIECVVRCRKA